jgi:hypothetical protein
LRGGGRLFPVRDMLATTSSEVSCGAINPVSTGCRRPHDTQRLQKTPTIKAELASTSI